MKMKIKKMLKLLASVKLAVVVLVLLAIVSAVGTVIESKYDAMAADKLVYNTWYMYAVLGFLSINLIAVMIDRLPWQKKHIPFICAHIGILLILAGGVVTKKYGLDGSMAIPIGQKNRNVLVNDTVISLFSSFDAQRYSQTFEQEVDFFKRPPSPEKPIVIPLMEGDLKVTDYIKYAIGSSKVVPSDSPLSGAALRFKIFNENMGNTEWMVQRSPHDVVSKKMGLAEFILGASADLKSKEPTNAIYFFYDAKGLRYQITYKDTQRKVKTAYVKEGDEIETGWMNLKIQILSFLPKAKESWEFKKIDAPTPLSTQAIQIEYKGTQYWTQLNDVIKLFGTETVYIFAYSNKRIDIGYDIHMKKFNMDRYQGTQRAATYESLVAVDGVQGEHLISMNEPLKHENLTFYQASFQSDESGEPVVSVLSVNYDPGRAIKYLGSLVMSIGVILLFYFKKYYIRKKEEGEA